MYARTLTLRVTTQHITCTASSCFASNTAGFTQ